jgi:hypothetical protein
MPLQNRGTPFGDLVAVEGRGLLMGNRGILHDGDRRIVRYAQGRRWIACLTSFRGRRRVVMRRGSYTELFFLDEAAALAAGHRPCAECRYQDYRRFVAAWTACYPGEGTSADGIDRRLHRDRLAGPRTKRTYTDDIARLPDGTYVDIDGVAWLIREGAILAWSASGYTERRERPVGAVRVLTPRCVVDVIRAGYRPAVHPSAAFPPDGASPALGSA